MILIVDDSELTQLVLQEYLIPLGYPLVFASNGREALNLLCTPANNFLTVLLDREMPEMNGMEVLSQIATHDRLWNLPIILQTARSSKEEIEEGIKAGAYYYLTKPYTMSEVRMITKTAIADYKMHQEVSKNINKTTDSDVIPAKNQYSFSKVEEVAVLANLLSRRCPNPVKVSIGLFELLSNAVEHGNLGITYHEKTKLIQSGELEMELRNRSLQPKYAGRTATVTVEKSDKKIVFRIKDEGSGFDWAEYLVINPIRAFDSHGRGIAMSRKNSFHSLEYLGNGNEVVATINL
jgi:CheY-like chemotaxis protein